MFGKFIIRCPHCGTVWEFDGCEIYLEPWPHGVCPNDGSWLAAF